MPAIPDGVRGDGSTFFVPATHTPDGFDCAHEGYVWFLEIDDAKSVTAESLRTGVWRFLRWEIDIRTEDALRYPLSRSSWHSIRQGHS